MLSNRPPDSYWGKMIGNKPRWFDFYQSNGLSVWFSGSKYYYEHKKCTVKVACLLENKSNDTLLFDRRSFSLCSNNGEYILEPVVADTLLVPPGLDGKDVCYRFEFVSKDNMPFKLIANDTLRFQYLDNGQMTTVFQLVPVLKVDPTLTKEEIIMMYTN